MVTRRAPLPEGPEMDEYLAQVAGSVAIEALIGIGDLAGAERLMTCSTPTRAGSDTAVGRLACRCRGLLLAARGEHARAIEELEAAASDPYPPQGTNPFERARTLLALGSVQRRAQHKRAARETLELAADGFDRLGARLWEAKARAELRRIGGRTASKSELSETERQSSRSSSRAAGTARWLPSSASARTRSRGTCRSLPQARREFAN